MKTCVGVEVQLNISGRRHYMQMSEKFQTPAALPPVKSS